MATLGGFKSSKAKEWSADLWDRLMDALDARFGPLEEQLDIQRATTDAIVRRGLTVIEELLAPQATNASELLVSIEDQKVAAIALVATIQALLDAYTANHLSADLVDETASRLFLTPALKAIYDAKATPADIAAAIDALKGGVSTAYDTLVEIAAKLSADDTAIAGILSALAARVRFDGAQTLSGGEKAQVFTNLGLGTAASKNTGTSAGDVVEIQAGGRLPVLDGIVPVGTTIFVNATTPPAGYLKENGVLLSRTAYAALWTYAQASGDIVSEGAWYAGYHGCFSTGDGATNFRIPDSRGEFIRGWDDGRGTDPGRTIGSVQYSQNLYHDHGYNDVWLDAGGGQLVGNPGYLKWRVSTTSGSGGSEARPRNMPKLICIKY